MSDYKPTGMLDTSLHFFSHFKSLPPSSISHHSINLLTQLQNIENDGLRKDGQPDQRVGTGEFAHGKVDPVEAGKQGSDNPQGAANVGGDGLRKDGQPDQRLKQNQ
jgi:hypothetical protein